MTDTVLSSATREVTIGFDRPFVVIGERINPTGRKLLAAELKAGDYSRVEADALAQVAAGAMMLDVNAGIPLADEPAILARCIELVQAVTDVPLSIDVARRLEPHRISWYEEPVPPQQVSDTKTIHDAIQQPMAGGEFLFGMQGFAPLCQQRAVDIVMPDVKHCGGLAEARRIAAVADLHGVAVSPHNPSGPVATAASAQLCAAMLNFDILEFQWGEVGWRGDLIDPPERFENGSIAVSDAPGFGIALNDAVAAEHA